MNGREIRFSNDPVIFNPEESLNKYLLNINNSDLVADVESFIGEEALSSPYRYTIRFTSTTDDAEAFHIVKKVASFILRADNPAWSKYFTGHDKWVALRKIPGVITEISRIGSSADETLYEAVLEHPLALLNTRYRSAIYQNVSVPELVKRILKEHGFEGYEINFDLLHWEYPQREMIVQWKESDLAFIQRLLSEVGIWFRFELHPDHDHIVVIVFGDSGAHYVHNHKIAAINPAGTLGNIYSLRKMTTRHTIVPGLVDVRNYNYRESRSYRTLETQADKSRLPELVCGSEYHYADNHLASGDRYAIGKGQHAETSWHFARIRHECLLTNMITLEAIADDPVIVPGFDLDITGSKPAAFDEGMVQGFGWRGVPQKLADTIPNLRQRVFFQNSSVGHAPDGKPFRKPAAGKGDFAYSSVTNASWDYSDVVPNGETLPEPFIFTLMGQLNPLDTNADKDNAYKAPVGGNDVMVSHNAKAGATSNARRTKEEVFDCPPFEPFKHLQPGHVLTKKEINSVKSWRNIDVVSGEVTGVNDANKKIVVRRNLTEAELHKLFTSSDDVMFSQHSSIVISPKVPELAMAYDLAIGPCKSFDFEHGAFWRELITLADWRSWSTDSYARNYYRTGELRFETTKKFMNKPDQVLPKGEFGVVNQFMNATRVIPAR